MDFPPPIGRRPAVLVSRNQAYQIRASITVVPVTRKVRGIPVEVGLGPADGIPRKSDILCDGDIIGIDFGIYKNGYCADVARTVMVGAVSPEKRKLVETAKNALEAAKIMLKPARQIDPSSQTATGLCWVQDPAKSRGRPTTATMALAHWAMELTGRCPLG